MKKKLEAAELEHRLENEVIDVTLQEHCQLTYLSAACCQLLCTRYLKEKRCAC